MISGTLLLASSLTYSHCSSVTPFNAYTGTQIATSAKQKKQKKEALNFAQSRAIRGFFGGEQGIRTLEHPFRCYTISNRAPSASSDISPHSVCLTNVKRLRSIAQLRCGLKRFFRVEAFAATVRRILRGMIQDAPHRRGWLTVKPSDSPVSLHCPFISRRNCVQ